MNDDKQLIETEFMNIQNDFIDKILLKNQFSIGEVGTIAGIDLAYWTKDGKDYAVCCIVTIDYLTKKVLETKYLVDEINVPYIAGYLSFRELPLILKTYELLEMKPDLVMFDGNGYLHYRHMGIATHASFYLNKPTIGVAKSYLKIAGVEFIVPENKEGAYSDIVINNEVYGRALRTHNNVKPIFVSCGNWIDLSTATDIVLSLIRSDSRQPIPIRLADIETRKMRKLLDVT